MSLHRSKGGKACQRVEPSEREGFGLAVGAAMQWSKLRDSTNPQFFPSIAAAVKDCEGTERNWVKDDISFFVQQRLFGGIPQYAVEKWIQREFMGVKGSDLVAKRRDVIEQFIYKYRLFFPIDADDDWISPPFNDKSVCFRKPHLPDAKASAAELRSAAAALTEDSDDE